MKSNFAHASRRQQHVSATTPPDRSIASQIIAVSDLGALRRPLGGLAPPLLSLLLARPRPPPARRLAVPRAPTNRDRKLARRRCPGAATRARTRIRHYIRGVGRRGESTIDIAFSDS